MVEKAGHKKYLRLKRIEWIGEGKPKAAGLDDDDDDLFGDSNQPEERDIANIPTRIAPIFENSSSKRAKTPVRDDPFVEEDIYDATPKRPTNTTQSTASLFGGGISNQDNGEPDEDDLDALMAEAEAHRPAPTSIFGTGKVVQTQHEPDEDDLDALMAEAEANTFSTRPTKPANKAVPSDEEDDLDALMAEAEAQSSTTTKPPTEENGTKNKGGATVSNSVDEDEEAAIAEMDGLW